MDEPIAFEAFQQSVVYAAAAQSCGARIRWLDLLDRPVLAVERGPVRLLSRVAMNGEAKAQRVALRRLARWPGVTLATPEQPTSGVGLVPLVTSQHHAIWQLTGALRERMTGKWRNRLIVAEGRVTVSRASDAALDTLIRNEARQRRARGYRALPERFTRAIPAGALRIWAWRDAGGIGAAMAFVVHGRSATYHLGWASELARQAGVHGVMLARAAEALAEEGVQWLDLGLVDTEAAPGLARFKLGTGAALTQLGATCLVLP